MSPENEKNSLMSCTVALRETLVTFTVLTGLTSMARRRQTKTKEGEVEETVSARRRSSGGGGGGGGVEAAANCGENDGVGGGEEERKRGD
jgi:hypothetical protein